MSNSEPFKHLLTCKQNLHTIYQENYLKNIYICTYILYLFWVSKKCVSTGTDPVTDPTTLGLVAKVVESWEKVWKKPELVMKSVRLQTGRELHHDKTYGPLTLNRQAASQTDKL